MRSSWRHWVSNQHPGGPRAPEATRGAGAGEERAQSNRRKSKEGGTEKGRRVDDRGGERAESGAREGGLGEEAGEAGAARRRKEKEAGRGKQGRKRERERERERERPEEEPGVDDPKTGQSRMSKEGRKGREQKEESERGRERQAKRVRQELARTGRQTERRDQAGKGCNDSGYEPQGNHEASCGIRTHDLPLTERVLYQLS